MIGVSAPDVKGFWKGINRIIFTEVDNTEFQFTRHGPRKIATGGVFGRIHRWGIPKLSYSDVGFTPSKATQMRKLYYPQLEINRFHGARAINYGKTYSHAIPMIGVSDKWKTVPTTKGPCLQTIVICFTKGIPRQVHIFYRTTEISKKFYADLVFLDGVFKDIMPTEIAFCEVWFHIPMAYGHINQFPVVDMLVDDWKGWEWKDEKIRREIDEFLLALLQEHAVPKWGMVKRTGEWYIQQRGAEYDRENIAY